MLLTPMLSEAARAPDRRRLPDRELSARPSDAPAAVPQDTETVLPTTCRAFLMRGRAWSRQEDAVTAAAMSSSRFGTRVAAPYKPGLIETESTAWSAVPGVG